MKNHRPRFNLDMDGVVIDWLGGALPIIQQVTGQLYFREDFTTWDIYDVIGREHAPACNKFFHAEGFCAGLLPYAGAIEGVERLRAIADVRPVTLSTHSRHWYFERGEWVQRYLGINPMDVHHTRYKEDVFGHFFLDDRAKHVEEWAVHHPDSIALLWDHPYNRGEEGMLKRAPGNARRVRSEKKGKTK